MGLFFDLSFVLLKYLRNIFNLNFNISAIIFLSTLIFFLEAEELDMSLMFWLRNCLIC